MPAGCRRASTSACARPLMGGAFPFPVKYGYATVGRVEAGPAELAHIAWFSACIPTRASSPCRPRPRFPFPTMFRPARAVLAANMETALNAVWDGAPGPADRIAVVGGGLVGLLVAYLCARLPAAEVTVVDIAPARAELARALGARFARPDAAPADCDLVFHASGTAAGLATALRLAGEEASIVELSWYGSGDIAVPLGEAFHSRRLRLVSSQVGKVAPSHRARWTHGGGSRRRLRCSTIRCSTPCSRRRWPSRSCRRNCLRFSRSDSDGVCQLIRYPGAGDETH